MHLILSRPNFSKSLAQTFSLPLVAAFVILSTGCGGADKLESISLTPKPIDLPMGVTQQYTAMGHYANGDVKPIKPTSWTSSEAAIAQVSDSGQVTAERIGSTNLTIIAGDVIQQVPINIVNTVIQSIALTPENQALSIDSTLQLTATGTYTDGSTRVHMTLIPSGYVDYVWMPAADWQTSNEAVATVSASGLVTLHKAGSAKITATIGKVVGTTTVSAATATTASALPSAH